MTNGKICKKCGSDLTGRQESFCSDKCRKQFHNDKRKVDRKCLNCGAETTKKYCCPECGTEYRNKHRKRYHENDKLNEALNKAHKLAKSRSSLFTKEDREKFIQDVVDSCCD